ncbi:hypothetical protein GCM10009625_14750 [Brachybacterium fresconis]
MYSVEAGAWFSLEWSLVRHANDEIVADVEFNYDFEPAWDTSIDPVVYALDLERFPRREENIPSWLEAKLRDAQRSK